MKLKIGQKALLIGLLIILVIVAGCSKNASITDDSTRQITLYKSATCGCCGLYGQYLDKRDYAVNIIEVEDPQKIKDKFSVPSNLRSCHTGAVGSYFVEGHIPTEAIEKLMKEKPDIAGIAMPGMPSGSPGMPGSKKSDFVIYAVAKDGSINEFMRI